MLAIYIILLDGNSGLFNTHPAIGVNT